jgi:hypothetical protein
LPDTEISENVFGAAEQRIKRYRPVILYPYQLI